MNILEAHATKTSAETLKDKVDKQDKKIEELWDIVAAMKTKLDETGPAADLLQELRMHDYRSTIQPDLSTPAERAARNNIAHCGAVLIDIKGVIEQSALCPFDAPALEAEFYRRHGLQVLAAQDGCFRGPPEFPRLLNMIAGARVARRWQRPTMTDKRKEFIAEAQSAINFYMLVEKSARAGLFAPGGKLEMSFRRLSLKYAKVV